MNMKITVSIEINGKSNGLTIEIDEDAIKQEHKDDPNLKVITDSIINTIIKVGRQLVKEIVIYKDEEEIVIET